MLAVVFPMGLLQPAAASADSRPGAVTPGVFFGGTGGFGMARISHPELERGLRPGGYVVLDFGWALTERWSVGGEFSAWGTSPLGTPVHLHTIGARADFAPWGPAGAFGRLTAGYSLTEGDLAERAGLGGALAGGYRWFATRWISLAPEAGVHAHLYENGNAVFPFLALSVRFHGLTPPR